MQDSYELCIFLKEFKNIEILKSIIVRKVFQDFWELYILWLLTAWYHSLTKEFWSYDLNWQNFNKNNKF